MPEALADEQRNRAGECRGDADKRNGQQHVHFQRGEAYANGQRVDGGGHRLEQQYRQRKGALRGGLAVVFVFMEGVPHHLAADEAQDHEGDDTGVLGDDLAYQLTQQIAHKRHKELERAEGDGHGCLADAAQFRVGEGVGDGNGERIHRKRQAQHDYLGDSHKSPFFYTALYFPLFPSALFAYRVYPLLIQQKMRFV